MIIMDYKMKIKPISFRETYTEFYGKRGSSWQGAVLFYVDDHNTSSNCNGN